MDIARAPNGTWWVISDRTQAPSGAGYALENRLVSGRTLPAMLDQCRVRPLTDFFEVTIKALLNLAPNRPANPRVVVLSAGPNSETYFEHSFFARQWDFPLVGGGDLTVRDGRVYLKTLAGLNPVDVILRRLDDDFCDPLELRGDSLLGVPGLVQAARAGTVFVANCLGSGLVETPALMAFLPSLCREVLGEELRMPSVATWWCGQDEPRRAGARASRDSWSSSRRSRASASTRSSPRRCRPKSGARWRRASRPTPRASSLRSRWTCPARRCTRTAASRRATSCCACSPPGTAPRTRCSRAG